MTRAPQRFLANDRNLVLEATLTPSSVYPVDDLVIAISTARAGSAEARLTGSFDGPEEAEYEIEIVDTTAAVARVSAPVFAGAGSARLVDLAATGVAAQDIIVELTDPGKPATYAAVSLEGVSIKARDEGAAGNDLRIEIDQSGLVFEETDYALLTDLQAGQGSPSGGLEGAGFDWDTAVLGADSLIPATAHRIVFGEDRSTIYLAYKRYADNRWLYHFVPEIKRAIPKGAPVLFVTGGRTVTISDGASPDETYTGIATVYDLLSQIRSASQLVTVDGVVANDRSPTGQAALELLARTDAHVEPSTGTGSESAREFDAAFANANARTELVTARCFAVTGKDHPLARLGLERWQVSSSLGGVIGEAVTAEPFVDPDALRFGFTIPRRLPPGYGVQKGRFSYVSVSYVGRTGDIEPPPVCPVALTLGTAAVDQTITLKWTKRPSGECACSGMAVPRIGGPCLGSFSEGGEDMGYSSANRARLVGLYEWYWGFVRSNTTIFDNGGSPTGQLSAIEDSAIRFPTGAANESLKTVVGWFEQTIASLEELEEGASPDLRGAGETEWDAALQELQDDLDALATGDSLLSIANERYRARLDLVLITAGISPLGKTDASTLQSGDGCWRDEGDAYYWSVDGSVNGGYAPAFANSPYYSSRRASDEGRYFATHEFGFQINVACPEQLEEGDTITLAIGDAGWPSTYQVGDVLTLPVIAAAPLYLAGGRDDDSEQTWSVTGSVDGPFAPWQFTPGASPTAYSDAGLSWDVEAGGIDSAKGDRFTFAVEGGHWRWRKNAGSWSSSTDIPTAPVALDSGLSIEFAAGASPSFAAGDVYSFRALQPWAVSNVATPRPERWRWADESGPATLDIDLGSVQDLDTIAIALHTIPTGTTITLDGGDAAPNEWTEPIAWRAGVIAQTLSEARTARYLTITIDDGADGSIGWLWVGEALATELSADVQLRGAFKVARGGDGPLYQGGATLGRTRSAVVSWSEGALTEDDAQALIAMFEWVKGADDEPIVLIPHVSRPEDAVLGRIIEDELEFTELSAQNRNSTANRRYATQFTVSGVWQR